jgi:hypothetical protein
VAPTSAPDPGQEPEARARLRTARATDPHEATTSARAKTSKSARKQARRTARDQAVRLARDKSRDESHDESREMDRAGA